MIWQFVTRFAETCSPARSVYGIPTWYRYLPGEKDVVDPTKCIPQVSATNQLPAIGLGIVDILLHVAGIIVVGYVIYGGFLYMTSQGEADRTAAAKGTILNAVIGLVIVLIAIGTVAFVGRSF